MSSTFKPQREDTVKENPLLCLKFIISVSFFFWYKEKPSFLFFFFGLKGNVSHKTCASKKISDDRKRIDLISRSISQLSRNTSCGLIWCKKASSCPRYWRLIRYYSKSNHGVWSCWWWRKICRLAPKHENNWWHCGSFCRVILNTQQSDMDPSQGLTFGTRMHYTLVYQIFTFAFIPEFPGLFRVI